MSIETVKEAFAQAATGHKVIHAAMQYVGPAQVLEFDGTDDRGMPFHAQSEPSTEEPHQIAARLGLLQKNRILEKLESHLMPITKFGSFALDIKSKLASLKNDIDSAKEELGSAMAEGAEVHAQALNIVKQVKAEVAEAKAALGQLTNGPESE